MSDIQKNVTAGRPKGCLNYPPEFKQRLVAESCKPGVSISRLALDNGINANLLFKWRQLWRQGKLQLPSETVACEPLLIPVTLESETPPVPAATLQPSAPSVGCETLNASCEVAFRHGTLRLNGSVSENLLAMLIRELKR
ncbi:TPA: IS66-like element accessory protein TnpA [Salmonella enterica subsp. enterica serovar Muenchen]